MIKEISIKDNEKYFKIVDNERLGKTKIDKDLNKKYGSFELLKYKEFGFSLGLGQDKVLSFGGNCKDWSNAFNSNPTFKSAFLVIDYFNRLGTEQQKKIKSLLIKYPNKLFLNKDRDTLKINWDYFPTEDYNKCIVIPYINCEELKGVLE